MKDQDFGDTNPSGLNQQELYSRQKIRYGIVIPYRIFKNGFIAEKNFLHPNELSAIFIVQKHIGLIFFKDGFTIDAFINDNMRNKDKQRGI